MKFKVLIVLSFVFTAFFTSCDEDVTVIGNWVTKAYFTNYSRSDGTSFSLNGAGYWGMGYNSEILTDFWKYDAESNSWTEVASFPGQPRYKNVSISVGSKGYMGLGYDGNTDLADFWEYDANTNEWKQIGDFPGGARSYATAFAINDDIYVGTGSKGKTSKKIYTNDFYKLSNGVWEQSVISFPGEKREYANAIGFNNKGYLISGYHSGLLNDFWEFDPANKTWLRLDRVNDEDNGGAPDVARYNASIFASEGNIYLACGIGSVGSPLASIYEWNPTKKIWTQKTDIESGISRQGAGTFVINGYGYIVGGLNGTSRYLDDCYKFEPSTEKNSDD